MGAENLKVSYDGLDQMATQLLNTAVGVDDKLNTLETKLEGYMAEWSGDDRQAYKTAKQTWDKAMQEMLMTLQSLSKAVGLSKEEYQAAEKQNAARFS